MYLTPQQSYRLAQSQKRLAAEGFAREIRKFCEYTISTEGRATFFAKQRGEQSARDFALSALASRVEAELSKGGLHEDGFESVLLREYRSVALEFGLKQIDPNGPNFSNDLNEFHRNYVTNFPIAAEQESFAGFETLLSAPALSDGYIEVAYSLVCPITGKYLMGLNFTIQPSSNSAHFVYGFVVPWARKPIGFSRALVAIIKRVATEHISRHPTRFPGEPLITFEKNILAMMTLEEILMDSAGVNVESPPVEGVDLTLSSIDQSVRDLAWSRLGAKIVDYTYLQSSLDGVVKISDSKEEALVSRYLTNGPDISIEQSGLATNILEAHLGEKEEGCCTLNLCVFAGDAEFVNEQQIFEAMKAFQGVSVTKQSEEIEQDIYFRASISDLRRKAKDGRISLRPIAPFGGEIPDVQSFEDAAALTELLLGILTWSELRENPDRTYAEWLNLKSQTLMPLFREYKLAHVGPSVAN